MICWGKRVSQEFRGRVLDIAIDLNIPVDFLMAVMAFESGRSFRSDKKNLAGSGATGLIQFMPSTALALGTTIQDLSKMTPEDQLFYVHKYFLPYKHRLKTIDDVYMAVLWPRAIGEPDDFVLFDVMSKPTTYRQNASLDFNRDGKITKAEAAKRVRDELQRGYEAQNFE
jgi:hypothetical protein